MAISVRIGKKVDLPAALALIRELAVFEKAGDQVITTVEQMERDGFGDHPVFGFFVAEADGAIVGLSLYYWRYSTWKGKRLYLEDIVVTEAWRGKGIGKLLFEATMRRCLEEGCTGMMWQVLEWNKPAIDFYKKYDSFFDPEWVNCSLEAEAIRKGLAGA
ncbi:MAG: GNAT family N-acetyltransferase [Cyclobacteriaceae bacterium]|jgi:GNAT superfamily N-acetyltransferase